jgi:hypothetical protein
MSAITRQQLCGELRMSESRVKQLEKEGLPFIASPWTRRKTYDLVAVKTWLNKRKPGSVEPPPSSRRFHSGMARARALRRVPPWADTSAIKAIYEEAHRLEWESSVPHQVDHVIPLQGELVSGLHVHQNLQILTGCQNSQKRNTFEVTP